MRQADETTMIETIEKYWDTQPCNVKHGTAPVGTKEWSEQVRNRKYLVEPHIPLFANFAMWNGKSVLEIGCGIGTDTLSFLEHGAIVDALDLSEESLKLTASRTEEYGKKSPYQWRSRARLFHVNAEDWLPGNAGKGGYDLVYSFGVLHHTPNPLKVLRNARSKMKQGAELRIMLYAKYSWKNLFTRQQPEAQGGCPLARKYTVKEARDLVEMAGFKVESIEKTHIFPWRIKDYIQHRYVKAWPWKILPKPVFLWLEKVLGWHLLIKAVRPVERTA